jgi:hypothetical protein
MVGTLLDVESGHEGRVLDAAVMALKGDEPATRPGLFVEKGALAGSTHEKLRCVDCHEDAARLPHDPKLNRATCATASCVTGSLPSIRSAAAPPRIPVGLMEVGSPRSPWWRDRC